MGERGPKPIQINWDEVIKLMSYQCTQEEVAHFFGISLNTLERACERDHGTKLGEFWLQKRAMGRVKLRKAQFNIVEKGGPGAATLAIYLDKKLFPDERPDLPKPEATPAVQAIGSGRRTFAEFCAKAGYFTPFAKQEEMRSFGIDRTDTRLLLGARGYGKTDYVTIMGIAYDLYCGWHSGQDLDLFTNLIITKSKSRNKAITNEISNALKKNGVELDVDNSTEIRIQGLIGQDHSVEAITIKTSMRGRHPKRIVMDDPVTDEDTSAAMRNLVKKKYDEAYKLCKNILIIGQPAHFDDLYAHLRELITTLCVPHGTIPELDADLAAMKLAGVDTDSIEMSYHLRVPETGSSAFANIKYVDDFPAGDSVAFLDPSDGGDYTALSVIKGYMAGVAVQGHVWKKAYYHIYDDLVPILKSRGVRRLCFETNKHGEGPLIQLRELLGPHGIGVVGHSSKGDKHGAIEQAGSYSHMIHLSKTSDKVYTDHVVKYEYKAKYDDAPDSLARGLQWLGLLKEKK